MIYTIPIRDPNVGYRDTWLWLPKSRISVNVIKNSLTVPITVKDDVVYMNLWRDSPNHLGVPREKIRVEDLPYPVVDLTPLSYEEVRFHSKVTLDYVQPNKDEQQRAYEAMITTNGGILNLACVSGDTRINFNRGGKGFSMKIETAYHRLHYDMRYGWDRTIPTYVRSKTGDRIRLQEVSDIVYKGIKLTMTLKLEDGRSLRLTGDHKVLTPRGWVEARRLTVGDAAITDGRQRQGRKTKSVYKRLSWYPSHPFVRVQHGKDRKTPSYVVEEHRAVAEAALNGLTLDQFRERCQKGNIENLQFIDPDKFHVHHDDEDIRNNDPSNLVVMPRYKHLKHHQPGYHAFGYGVPTPVRITSILEGKFEPVYDIVCKDPHHNYVANGVVIHNCGKGKCLGIGTPVMRYDGQIVPAEKIVAGDTLMGPDGLPRRVLSTTRGSGSLYQIKPFKGDPWVCNGDHILTLVKEGTDHEIEISVDDFLRLTTWRQKTLKLFSTKIDHFYGVTHTQLPIDPYFFGIWVGDDSRFLLSHDLKIPREYLVASRQERLAFLAGVLDTDGNPNCGGYEVVQKREDYANAICFVARSLGFRVTRSLKIVADTTYQRMRISGDCSKIPVRIPRKKIGPRRQIKNVLKTGFRITTVGEGEYAGFELTGDGRFLLGDFTVTHNTVISLHHIANRKMPALIINDKTHILQQWIQEINRFLVVPGELGWIQGHPSKWRWRCPITLASLKSLAMYANQIPPGMANWFGTIIWDESVPGHATVLTEDGYKTIQQMVSDHDQSSRVVGYDPQDQTFRLCSITKFWAHPPRSEMLKITHTTGSFQCTANHPVLTSLGYIPARELTPGIDSVILWPHDGPGLWQEDTADHRFATWRYEPDPTPIQKGATSGLSRVLRVESVETPEVVYDLSVEHLNNFIVDGVVLHNCHHLSADEFSKTADMFYGSRFGVTATVEREDGGELLYLWHVGKVFHKNLSQDVVPSVTFFKSLTKLDMDDPDTFRACTDKRGEIHIHRLAACVGMRPEEIAFARSVVDEGLNRGRDIIAITMSKDHAQRLHELYPNSGVLHEGVPAKRRLEVLRNHKLTFATISMAKEALNKQKLDSLIILTEFSSKNMLQQSMGRIQRYLEGKKQTKVIVIWHVNVRPMKNMGHKLMHHFRRWGMKVEVK